MPLSQYDIKQLAESVHPDVIRIRRHLHRYPELSFQEKKTAAYIQSELKAMGIDYRANVGGYGIVADICGQNPDHKCIALRADMDALPIQEANDVPYASVHSGVMHACGHDVHTAGLLGAARILSSTKNRWTGTVRLLFQPAEERMPGGAQKMIKEGVLNNPRVDAVIGQHVHPEYEIGSVGFRKGAMMASADEIYIDIIGRGGHAALPHNTIDPVAIAAQVVVQLQSLISRVNNPIQPSVLTIGRIESPGGSTNVVAHTVKMQGTFRSFDESWRQRAHRMIEDIASTTAKNYGAKAIVHIVKGYPALHSDPQFTELMHSRALEYLGSKNVHEMPIRMTAEDFAYFALERPSCFYRLGTSNKSKGIHAPVHTDTFDIDEDALVVGSGLMAWLALGALAR